MRLGLQISSFTWPGGVQQITPTFIRIAKQAEEAGFYSFWTMDHVLQPSSIGPIEQEVLEGWNALTFAAALTQRIKLGVLVTATSFRNPGLLVKTATTLDILSQGRSYLGVGAAWFVEEHHAYNIPFHATRERFERLEETLQIALQMWSGDESPYEGKHYQLPRPLNSPLSLQKPHPPIMIAGGGEKKTLRLVAQYGDACNLFAREGPETLRRKLDILRAHCESVGRPFEQIEKTSLSNLIHITRDGRHGSLSPSAAIDHFARLAELGFDQAIMSLTNIYEPEALELLATEIIPVVAKIPVADR